MTDIRALAIRFADLWAVDHHQMVDEIYAPDIQMEAMAAPGRRISGAAELHALEDVLAERIPSHRHELVRVLVCGTSAFLETTVLGMQTGEFAPAALWWDLDVSGQVAAEIGWFAWEMRSTDSRLSHGHVPPAHPTPRRDEWYRTRIEQAVETWRDDPEGTVTAHCAPGCITDMVGQWSLADRDALVSLVRGLPAHQVRVLRVLCEKAVVAVLVELVSGGRRTRSTVVVSIDDDDSVASCRIYLDWGRAVEVSSTAD
jgi:hypothetical protein